MGVCIYCTFGVFNNFPVYYYVNECSKSIGLGTIFKNILQTNNKLILLITFYYSYQNGISVCFGCFSLHLKTQKAQRLSHPHKKKKKKKKKENGKKRHRTFFYHFWVFQKFLLIWNKSIQRETFEILRHQLVHCMQTVLPHPNIRLNYSIRLVLIITNILFLQKNHSQTQLLANF